MPGLGLLLNTEPWVWIRLLGTAAFVIAAVLWLRRRPFFGKTLVYVALVVLVLRAALFDNPFAWRAYQAVLEHSDLDFRPRAMLRYNLHQLQGVPDARYLAVGSSQIPAVFGRYDMQDDTNQLVVFTLPGMSIMEYVLYWDTLRRYQPETIILYLSEFDFGRAPHLAQLDAAPAQWTELPRLWRLLSQHMPASEFLPHVNRHLMASVFPEYRHSFVFRGLWDKLSFKQVALNVTSPTTISNAAAQVDHLQRLHELTDQHVPFHLSFLGEFFRRAQQASIKVLVVEGQYHPAAYTAQNLALNASVRGSVRSLMQGYPNTRYIERRELHEFTPDEYRDGYHVHKAAGLAFTRQLMLHLGETLTPSARETS